MTVAVKKICVINLLNESRVGELSNYMLSGGVNTYIYASDSDITLLFMLKLEYIP